MGNEGSYVALGLKVWKAQIERADKLFGSLSSEDVLREIAPGRNRLVYLWGHLTAINDAMLPLLALRERLHPEFDVAFVSNPDRSQADIPSHEQVRRAWNVVNAELWKGFENMSWPDWVQRHSAVSEEDFAKDTSRNRFAVLLSRTNHLSYHLGQAVLALKTAAFGVYAASKAALRSFVRTWTTDLKDRRIRSNVVSPGPIDTPLASRQSAEVIALMVSTIPMGRMGTPEEVAKVALFLASDDSSFV